MIYELKGVHHRRAYVRGDLEAETIMVHSSSYNTRKAANTELVNIQKQYNRRGLKTDISVVGRGDKNSRLVVYTGDTWIHENSGEKEEEYYYYTVSKK